jgi:hypothetical protein
VTLSICQRVADLPKAQPGGKKFEYTRVSNQWAVFGGVLNAGTELSVIDVNLGIGEHVVMAACDSYSDRIDLQVFKGKTVNAYKGPPTTLPLILHRTFVGTSHGLRLRNSSTVQGSALVMMAVIDVTK